MPRSCTVCTHQHRDELEEALVTGESYRAISRHHGISRDALARHVRAGHVPVAIAVRASDEEAFRAESLTERAEFLWRRASSILDAAEGRPNIELQAIRELRATVELPGRLINAFAAEDQHPVIIALSLSDGTPLAAREPYTLPEASTDAEA